MNVSSSSKIETIGTNNNSVYSPWGMAGKSRTAEPGGRQSVRSQADTAEIPRLSCSSSKKAPTQLPAPEGWEQKQEVGAKAGPVRAPCTSPPRGGLTTERPVCPPPAHTSAFTLREEPAHPCVGSDPNKDTGYCSHSPNCGGALAKPCLNSSPASYQFLLS